LERKLTVPVARASIPPLWWCFETALRLKKHSKS